MGAKLSKDEKEYIENNAAAYYLLLKHDSRGGIDCFNVYDQGGDKQYSVNVKGKYRKDLPVLEISNNTGSVVGTIRWNDKSPSSNAFSVWYVGNLGRIEKKYEETERFFRKSWYEPSFSDWTLDYHTVYFGNGNKCAEINSISNYKNGLRGEKRIRDSYLIDRYYNTEDVVNDVLVLLFWAITYISDDYRSVHDNSHPVSIREFMSQVKLKDIPKNVKKSIIDRRDAIEYEQETTVEKLHDRANEYLEDKQARLQEKEESKSALQQILSFLISLFVLVAVPAGGYHATAYINQNIAGSFRINPLITCVVLFIIGFLIINKNNPESVIMYDWIKLILFCILGLIVCVILAAIMQYFIIRLGVNGIDVGLPLILIVIPGICKWMSRRIDSLVDARGKLSSIQFAAIGLLLGQVYLKYVDRSVIYPAIGAAGAILIVVLLSKLKLLVRKSLMHCVVGVSAGVLLVSVVGLVIKVLETH